MRVSRVIAALAAAVLLCGAAAHASRVVHMTASRMADISALIVSGRVSEVESFWNEKRTKIFTRTVIEVDETYKGDRTASVEIIQLGGTVGNIRVTVEGSLKWARGEEVLLFLEPYDSGRYQVSGLSQGKYLIERDPATGERFVSRAALEGVRLFHADGTSASGGRLEKVPLERFVSEVMRAE